MLNYTRKRKIGWSDEETEKLLKLWAVKMNDPINKMRPRIMYKAIELEMLPFYMYITKEEIRNKIKNLVQQYRKELNLIESSGGIPSNWQWFNHVHEVLGKQQSEMLINSEDDSTPNIIEEIEVENCSPSSQRHCSQSGSELIDTWQQYEMRNCAKKRKLGWTDEELKMLLKLWGEKCVEEKNKNSRTMYKEIQAQMSTIFPEINVDEIRNKIKNMAQQYRRELKEIGLYGAIPSQWPWFNQVHKILNEASSETNLTPNHFESTDIKQFPLSDFSVNSFDETANLAKNIIDIDSKAQQQIFHELVIEKFNKIDQRMTEQLEQQRATDKAMLEQQTALLALESKKIQLFEKLIRDHAELKDAILKNLNADTSRTEK